VKLVTTENSELMDVSSIEVEDGKLIVGGTIMGAMPIRAVLTGAELRRGFKLVTLGTIWQIIKIFLSGKS
jgi:hypothetical protein